MTDSQDPVQQQRDAAAVHAAAISKEGPCPTIYGPVPSRRLGYSLGINLGDPNSKVCTWGCLYCQCGMGERQAATPQERLPKREEVLAALKAKLPSCGKLDSITFAGNSEPCAHPEFPGIVRDIRKLKYATRGTWILNCLTNGSELDRDDVVNACGQLDQAWVKLDCGTDDLFRRLNRPLASVGTVAQHVARMKRLKKIWIQTLFWNCPQDAKLANWTEENRAAVLEILKELNPVETHVTTVSREPAWGGLTPVSAQELESGFAASAREAGLNLHVHA